MSQSYPYDIPVLTAKAQFYLGYQLEVMPEFERAMQRCSAAGRSAEFVQVMTGIDQEWQSLNPNLDRAAKLCSKLSELLDIPQRLIIFEQHADHKIRY